MTLAVAVLAAFAVWLLAFDSRSADAVPATSTQLVVDPAGDPGPPCNATVGESC